MNNFSDRFFPSIFVFVFVFIMCLFPAANHSQTENSVNSEWSKPLSICWKIETDKTTNTTLASDNVLIVSILTDSLRAYNIENGELVWKNELNGQNVSYINIKDNKLYLKSSQEIPDTKLGGRVSVIEAKSGVPFDAADSIADNFSLQAGQQITIPEKIIKENLSDGITELYFEKNKSQILIGTKIGSVKLFNTQTLKKLWNTKVGGEITEILSANHTNYIISSKDNYIYSVKKTNGKSDWRLKLGGRPIGSTLIGDKLMAAVDYSSHTALIIDIKTGKIVNRISFDADTYFVTKPVYTNNKLILTTNRGFFAVSAVCSQKKDKSAI